MAKRSRQPLLRAAALFLASAALSIASITCGARSALLPGGATTGEPQPGKDSGPPPSTDLCARADYDGGYTHLAVYLLLDKSWSMAENGRWDQVSAAISGFVDDPETAGLGFGLQYFPLGDSCDPEVYGVPAVPILDLPGNAANVKASLAKQKLYGSTPIAPALRAAITYARATLVADPKSRVLVAIATDGSPGGCDSSTSTLAAIASEGNLGDPQVLTYVIGFAQEYLGDFVAVCEAGGTGEPILLDQGDTTAQAFVDALKAIRDTAKNCTFGVPATGDAKPVLSDLTVVYSTPSLGGVVALEPLSSADACDAQPNGYFVDDPGAPTKVTLCPGACAVVQGDAGARVTVVAGCGGVLDGGPPVLPPPDGGCSGSVGFSCVSACGAGDETAPVCTGTGWACPPGTVSTTSCSQCSAAPHGCCNDDGTLAVASCINGVWTCPPGATIYGTGACKPPAVCSAGLPCAPGQFCKTPDYGCGKGDIPGTCVPIPGSCAGPPGPVCGCGGVTFPTACAASQSGVDISAVDLCTAPAGTFACGPRFCFTSTQICKQTKNLTSITTPNDYACVDMTPGCQTGCGCGLCQPCPPGLTCNETCGLDGAKHFVTCTEF